MLRICNQKTRKKNKKTERSKKESNPSNTSFRSRALRVMSPARFHCAMLLCLFVYLCFLSSLSAIFSTINDNLVSSTGANLWSKGPLDICKIAWVNFSHVTDIVVTCGLIKYYSTSV